MEKIIKIDDKEVLLKANAMFPILYKQTFGEDILTVILPLISEVLQNADDIFSEVQGDELSITPSKLGDLVEGVYSLEMVDILKIIWTTAKLGDKSIKPLENWIEEFDEFPIFEIGFEAIKIIIPTLISKKKLENIKSLLQTK